jgi:hypothetical protein
VSIRRLFSRLLPHKSRHAVAVPVLPAVHFGDSIENFAHNVAKTFYDTLR